MDVQRQMMNGARTRRRLLWRSLILLLFLIYFLLAQGEMFKQKFVQAERRAAVAEEGDGADDRRDHRADRPASSSTSSGAACWSASLTWAVFAWLGVRYAGLWGVAAGVLNCIPYFGPTIIMVASSAAAVLQFKSRVDGGAGRAHVGSRSRRSKDSCSRRSRSGRAASVNSVAVFVAVMFWGWMWGAARTDPRRADA